MPDNALAALYPQPPKPQGNALASGDPSQVLGLVNGINQLRLFNEQFPALAKQPAAALQGTEINNQTAQMQQNEVATKIVAGYLGSLPDKATEEDVYRMKASIRAVHPNISANTINTISQAVLRDPGGIGAGIKQMRVMGLSPSEAAGRVEGPPNAVGQKQSVPLSTAVREGAMPVENPPGETELFKSPAARAEKLQASASTSPQYHTDLENLRTLSKDIDIAGPTAESEKKLNQLASRLGLSITVSPGQLAKAEEFDKIANQISLNQSTLFHGSDASLHTVVGANPSLSMSKIGREGVISMLQGNQDAIDTARKAWLRARASGDVKAQDFDMFMERLGQELDPRVFQFNRMSRDNQQKFLDSMDKEDLAEFEQKFKKGIERKWVKPLKAETGGK